MPTGGVVQSRAWGFSGKQWVSGEALGGPRLPGGGDATRRKRQRGMEECAGPRTDGCHALGCELGEFPRPHGGCHGGARPVGQVECGKRKLAGRSHGHEACRHERTFVLVP